MKLIIAGVLGGSELPPWDKVRGWEEASRPPATGSVLTCSTYYLLCHFKPMNGGIQYIQSQARYALDLPAYLLTYLPTYLPASRTTFFVISNQCWAGAYNTNTCKQEVLRRYLARAASVWTISWTVQSLASKKVYFFNCFYSIPTTSTINGPNENPWHTVETLRCIGWKSCYVI